MSDAGIVSVVYGYASGFSLYFDLGVVDGINGFHINGAAAGDLTGAVGLGGDVNGDGFDDLHVGASQYNGGAGRGYTVFGYDYRRIAAIVGASGSAAAPGDLVIGSAGNDSLGDGAVTDTVLKGGAGDDGLFIVPEFGTPRLVHGGSGTDQLLVTSSSLFDLTTENQASGYGRYRELESMNLTSSSSLRVGVRDILRSTSNNTLFVEGATSAPQPVQSGDAWLREGFDDGSGVAHYRNGFARLEVAEYLNRDLVPVAFHWEPQTSAANGHSGELSLSGTGQRLVFESRADNLVGAPTVPAGVSQIYLRDVKTGAVTLVSQAAGVAGTADSTEPVISYDGRYVAFRTEAAELVGGDPPPGPQVVIADTTDGSIRVVSDDCGECLFTSTIGRISLSADARYVAFIGRPNPPDTLQVYRMDLQTGTLDPASVVGGTEYCGTPANPNSCYSAAMSGDGRWIAWNTLNDVLANDTNGSSDVLLRDMQTTELRLVSTLGGSSPPEHSAAPFISGDGRRIAFESGAAFAAGDTNGTGDIYVYDIAAQTLARASTDAAGADGPAVFAIAVGEDPVGAPVMSGDGRRLMYTSDLYDAPVVKALDCSNGCGVDVDDDLKGELLVGRLNRSGTPFNAFVTGQALSFDGRVLGAYGLADNVFAGDTNGQQDVFAGLNPLYASDSVTDSDGDGLTNEEELFNSDTNPMLADTDGDGLSDGDEWNVHFTDPATPDTDGDGVGDGMEVAFGSSANTPQGQVLRVSPNGHDFNCNGQSFADWDGNTPALVDCALQTNSGVTNILLSGPDWASRQYVLYKYNANYGALDLSGAPRQYISFVGSLDQGVYQPIGGADDPSMSAFVPSGQFPAAAFSDATNISFHNIRFTGGNGQGAGLSVSVPPASVLLLFEDVLVDNNGQSQDSDAGGVYVGVGSVVTMRRSKITNNLANNASSTVYGGGIMVADGTLVLEDSEVSGNTANGGGDTGIGGGIAAVGSSSSVTIRNSAISGNSTNGQGGGLSISDGANAAIELGSIVTGNSAQGGTFGTGIGGGIYLGLNSGLTVEDSRIADNVGGQHGGGLYVASAASLLLDNTIVAANRAEQDSGGGLYLSGAGSTEIRHSQFLSNQASNNGGGMYVENTSSLFRLFNTLLVANVTENSLSLGGGLHFAGSNDGGQTLVHSNTFAYNQARNTSGGGGGGAYFNQAGNIDFINNIFQFNDNEDTSTFASGQSVADVGAGNLSFANNNIQGDANPGGFDADPQFEQGFYLTQSANPSVNGATAPVFTAGSVGLLPPFTTSTDGAEDLGNLDLGYHHNAPSTGTLALLQNVSPQVANLPACNNPVTFTPSSAAGALGPGRRVVVVMTPSGVSASLNGRTMLEPVGAGSRLAIDHGDGRYEVRVQGFSGSGTVQLDVYVDDEPTPQTLIFSASFSCA